MHIASFALTTADLKSLRAVDRFFRDAFAPQTFYAIKLELSPRPSGERDIHRFLCRHGHCVRKLTLSLAKFASAQAPPSFSPRERQDPEPWHVDSARLMHSVIVLTPRVRHLKLDLASALFRDATPSIVSCYHSFANAVSRLPQWTGLEVVQREFGPAAENLVLQLLDAGKDRLERFALNCVECEDNAWLSIFKRTRDLVRLVTLSLAIPAVSSVDLRYWQRSLRELLDETVTRGWPLGIDTGVPTVDVILTPFEDDEDVRFISFRDISIILPLCTRGLVKSLSLIDFDYVAWPGPPRSGSQFLTGIETLEVSACTVSFSSLTVVSRLPALARLALCIRPYRPDALDHLILLLRMPQRFKNLQRLSLATPLEAVSWHAASEEAMSTVCRQRAIALVRRSLTI